MANAKINKTVVYLLGRQLYRSWVKIGRTVLQMHLMKWRCRVLWFEPAKNSKMVYSKSYAFLSWLSTCVPNQINLQRKCSSFVALLSLVCTVLIKDLSFYISAINCLRPISQTLFTIQLTGINLTSILHWKLLNEFTSNVFPVPK